jgi:hypothetical protein
MPLTLLAFLYLEIMMNEKAYQKLVTFMVDMFNDYKEEVNESNLAPSSKKDYVIFAEMFVKWVNGDFVPGGRL